MNKGHVHNVKFYT